MGEGGIVHISMLLEFLHEWLPIYRPLLLLLRFRRLFSSFLLPLSLSSNYHNKYDMLRLGEGEGERV